MEDQAEYQVNSTNKPPHIIFDLLGSLTVGGVKYVNANQVEVVIEGEVSASGCGDAAIAQAFGIKNIITALGDDDVLSNFTAEQLIDHILNNHDLDIELIISELKKSLE